MILFFLGVITGLLLSLVLLALDLRKRSPLPSLEAGINKVLKSDKKGEIFYKKSKLEEEIELAKKEGRPLNLSDVYEPDIE